MNADHLGFKLPRSAADQMISAGPIMLTAAAQIVVVAVMLWGFVP